MKSSYAICYTPTIILTISVIDAFFSIGEKKATYSFLQEPSYYF